MRPPVPVHAKAVDDPTAIVARLSPRPMGEATSVPRWIQWMPGGVHEIVASQGGKPVRRRVLVDRGTAAAAQRSLDRYLAAGRQRPFLDFDHLTGQAAAWVTAFAWRDDPEPGVYVEVEWSKPGEEAVMGKAYRAFSPAFFVDASDPSRVTGTPFVMGGLVNDPAFRGIQPLWAKSAVPSHVGRHPNMNKRNQLIALLGAIAALQQARTLLAAKAGDENAQAILAKDTEINAKLTEARQLQADIDADRGPGEGADLKVEVNDATAALQAKDSQIAELQGKVATLEADRATRAKADAKSAIEAAVARGAIPAADTAIQARWVETIERDPSAAELLAKLPGSALLTAGRLTSSQPLGQGGGSVTISREDSLQVLKAYSGERDSVRRAEIYGREIRARIEAGETLPIQAATNTLGTLAADLVAQRALDLLLLQFPVLTRISTDFSAEALKFGKKLTTRIVSIPTVGTYHATNGYVSQDTTTTDVDVTLDQHKFVQHEFGANELSGTTRNLFSEQAPGMAYALGKDLVEALYALTTAANYSAAATTITLANFDRAGVIKVGKALFNRGVPEMGRVLLLNPDYYAALHEDPAVVSLAAYQQSSVITEGKLPRIDGFEVFRAVNLPTTGNLTGFGFHPAAWAMVVRLPSEYASALPGANGGGIVNVITEPNTGLSIQQVLFLNHQLGKAYSRLAWMFGVAKAQTDAGQRLISAAP